MNRITSNNLILYCREFFPMIRISLIALLFFSSLAAAVDEAHKIKIVLPITTQGPLWPPSSLVDENGDFVVVGTLLTEVEPGVIVPVPNQAALVSKNTRPPLDSDGREDFSNPFGAAYDIIKTLDLRKGSPDLKMELYTSSFGPPVGDFGGGSRVPRIGDSKYNLNMLSGFPCQDIFPSESQRTRYTRDSFPLHKAPIPGFQGDQVAYDVDTGESFVPLNRSGAECPVQGCEGEDVVDEAQRRPITLGRWLSAKVLLTIKLVDYDYNVGAYTAAVFAIRAKNLLPNAIYQIMAFRRNSFLPSPIPKLPDPLALPQILQTDYRGNATFVRKVHNPFPDPVEDDAGLRISGLVVAYRSDYRTSGACALHYAPGVEVHALASTLMNYPDGITDFVTRVREGSEISLDYK